MVASPNQEVSIDAQELKPLTMNYLQAEKLSKEADDAQSQYADVMLRCAASLELIKEHEKELKSQLQLSTVSIAGGERVADDALIVMEGWAEASTEAKVDAFLEGNSNSVYIKSNPTPEDVTPVKLKNNRFAGLFEVITNLYALPKYGTMDLTPYFAPFYMIFFGFCLGEGGYGLLIMTIGLIVAIVAKGRAIKNIGWLTTLCGFSGMVFGLLSGSFFGLQMAEWTWLGDIREKFLTPDFLFSLSLVFGGVHILFALILKIVTYTHAYGFKYALSTIGWFMLLVSSALAYFLPESVGFSFSSPIYIGLICVASVLMVFFNTAGKNPCVQFGTGLWDTYNNVTGLVGDMLSYLRLFAIGLSGGILAMVFNQLAAGMRPDIIVVKQLVMLIILLIGHGINLFMCILSSLVHPMRLTFVEFYKNAGFESSSRGFTPLKK